MAIVVFGGHVRDSLVRFQCPTLPDEGNPGEQAVFDLVPFTGAGRIVGHDDLQASGFGEFVVSQPGTIPV